MNTQILTGKDYAEWLLSEVLKVEPKPVERKPRILTDAEMEAEASDYEDYLEDVEFWGSGSW